MQHYVVDWPLTVAVLTLIVAAIAAWFSWTADRKASRSIRAAEESLELSRTAWLSSPAADPLTPEELFVLTEIAGAGARGDWNGSANVGSSSVRCFGLGDGRNVALDKNPAFCAAVDSLVVKKCLSQSGSVLTLSDKGRGLLRRDRNSPRKPVSMDPPGVRPIAR